MMNIYAISVFGTAVTLPIMLIIFKFSTFLEVRSDSLNPCHFVSGVPSNDNENSNYAGNYSTPLFG